MNEENYRGHERESEREAENEQEHETAALAACARVIACFKVKQEAAKARIAQLEEERDILQARNNMLQIAEIAYQMQTDNSDAAPLKIEHVPKCTCGNDAAWCECAKRGGRKS